MAPLAWLQALQAESSELDSLQLLDLKTDRFTHAPHLSLFPLVNLDAEKTRSRAALDEGHSGRRCFLTIEENSLLETGKAFLIWLPAHFCQISFLYFIARMAQPKSQLSVISQEEKTLTLIIQTANREESTERDGQ